MPETGLHAETQDAPERSWLGGSLLWRILFRAVMVAVPLTLAISFLEAREFIIAVAAAVGGGVLVAELCFGRLSALDTEATLLAEEGRHLSSDLEAVRHALAAAETRAARYGSLFEAQAGFIVRRDRAGRVTLTSPAFAAALGKAPADLVGRPLSLKILAEERGDGATSAYEQRIDTVEGPRWIAWEEFPIRNGAGETVEVQSVGRDVTARKEAEAVLAAAGDGASAANAAKSRFLGSVTHEIRTPLNGILGMAGLLRDTALTPEQKNYVQAIASSGETLLASIEEILDFTKLEAGKIDLDAAPFSPEALVLEVAELLGPRAQAKDLDLAIYLAPDLPARVAGDAGRVRQILLNLVGNAIKFTERGGVAVLGRAERESGGRPILRLDVRDTGVGIASNDLDRVFGEFEQGDASRRHAGTGLGLAIARRLASLMGGEVGVESAPGRGSTFTVRLPLDPVEQGRERAAAAPSLAGERVLLASASGLAAPLLARTLAEAGAQVERAPSLAATAVAIQRPGEQPFSVALVDLAFGLDALLAFAAGSPHSERPRLVALLTPAERHALPQLKEAGFGGYLVKPVRPRSLVEQVAKLARRPDLAPAEESPSAPPLSVLLVEDNEVNATLALRLLERGGHRVIWARDGAEAVEAVHHGVADGEPYDLVLMDLHLPGLDGFEAARAIRSGLGDPVIVALTANNLPEERRAAAKAGFDDFLLKPLGEAALRLAVERAARKTGKTGAPTRASPSRRETVM